MFAKSDSIVKLSEALVKAQAAFPSVTKDKTAKVGGTANYQYSYAELSTVLEAIRKPLAENGLAIVQPTSLDEGGRGPAVTTVLLHSSGEWLASTLTIPCDTNMPQKVGSAISYCRRYSLLALLGLAAEDDDAASAGEAKPRTQPHVAEAADPGEEGDAPRGYCPDHPDQAFRQVPAGVSKTTGKPYHSFWACPTRGCKRRPQEAPPADETPSDPSPDPNAAPAPNGEVSDPATEEQIADLNRKLEAMGATSPAQATLRIGPWLTKQKPAIVLPHGVHDLAKLTSVQAQRLQAWLDAGGVEGGEA